MRGEGVAGLQRDEVGGIQGENVLEQRLAHVGHHPLAELVEVVEAESRRRRQDRDHHPAPDEGVDQRAAAVVDEAPVDHPPGHPRHHQQGERGGEQEEQPEDRVQRMGPHVRRQSGERAQVALLPAAEGVGQQLVLHQDRQAGLGEGLRGPGPPGLVQSTSPKQRRRSTRPKAMDYQLTNQWRNRVENGALAPTPSTPPHFLKPPKTGSRHSNSHPDRSGPRHTARRFLDHRRGARLRGDPGHGCEPPLAARRTDAGDDLS